MLSFPSHVYHNDIGYIMQCEHKTPHCLYIKYAAQHFDFRKGVKPRQARDYNYYISPAILSNQETEKKHQNQSEQQKSRKHTSNSNMSLVIYFAYNNRFRHLVVGLTAWTNITYGILQQERRLKHLITLGGLEIGIQRQIVNALELSTSPPPPPPQKKTKKTWSHCETV